VFLFCALPVRAQAQERLSLGEWMPWAGDRLMVDTKTNSGYLVHTDGSYIEFPVATGQRRTVHYIGLTYFAATPERTWSAETLENKGKSVTFGPTGRFIRLFHKDERTSYGIHGHRDIAQMLESDKRYYSMGCILVGEEILNIIETTYNELGGFEVITVHKKPLPEFSRQKSS
jgi:hypothetical protein